MARIPGHAATNLVMDINADDSTMVTGGLDGMIGIWDPSEMVCVHMLDRFETTIKSLSLSFDSKLLASTAEDGFVDIVSDTKISSFVINS